jgi:hypothetical protein
MLCAYHLLYRSGWKSAILLTNKESPYSPDSNAPTLTPYKAGMTLPAPTQVGDRVG